MLPGFNHNIRHRETVFHVQTEDSGPGQFSVVTQLFLDGHVLAVERFRYDDLWSTSLEEGERREALRNRMQDQHKGMLRRLVDGQLDDRIVPFLAGRTTRDTEEVGPDPAAFDGALPPELLASAEAVPVAPPEPPSSFAGARTSVLRPPDGSVELGEISVEGLVDNLEEWSEPTRPAHAAERAEEPTPRDPVDAPPPGRIPPMRRPMPSAQDTIVDARLPAALRAAQQRLQQQGAAPPPRFPPTPGASRPTPVRRVEVRDMRPREPDPSATGATGTGRSMPPRTRPNIPTNDKTMLEIDPIALKQAMARQRAQMEAQKKQRASQDLEPTRRDPPAQPEVVSEPSLDDVIMSYLKDQD